MHSIAFSHACEWVLLYFRQARGGSSATSKKVEKKAENEATAGGAQAVADEEAEEEATLTEKIETFFLRESVFLGDW